MANNSHGYTNEQEIINCLNGKKVSELNTNLQNFIKFIAKENIAPETIIMAKKMAGTSKEDIIISFLEKSYTVSIKMGEANSVHQERVDDFTNYLENDFKFDKSTTNFIKFFIWGDGTYDGSGQLSERKNAKKLASYHSEQIEKLSDKFNDIRVELFDRFVFRNSVDYIYYGNSLSGVWASRKEVLEYVKNSDFESTAVLSIGPLTFQAWNRSLSGTSDHKRGVIQLKWGTLFKDLENIRGEND